MVNHNEDLNIPPSHRGYLKKLTDFIKPQLWKPHTHKELEFNMVTGGTGYYIINDQRYLLERGSVIWLFPEQKHMLMDCTQDFNMWIAVFKADLVKSVCLNTVSVLNSQDPGKVFTGILLPFDIQYLNQIFIDIFENSEDEGFLNAGLAYGLRRSWMAYENAEKKLANHILHPAVVRMIELMTSSSRDVELSSLARKSGLSYSRLSRVFKKQTGQSLQEFRDRLRLEKFCTLFGEDPRRPRTMIDCALDSGFGSYAQFYRTFKKHMNKSPFDYWKNELTIPG